MPALAHVRNTNGCDADVVDALQDRRSAHRCFDQLTSLRFIEAQRFTEQRNGGQARRSSTTGLKGSDAGSADSGSFGEALLGKTSSQPQSPQHAAKRLRLGHGVRVPRLIKWPATSRVVDRDRHSKH
jgi:hypothetical protein